MFSVFFSYFVFKKIHISVNWICMHHKLVYTWRKYDIRSLCVHFRFLCIYCAFNLFVDDEHISLSVREHLTQRTDEINLRHSCISNRRVILEILAWKANAAYVTDFERKQWWFFAFPTATVRVYIKRTSFQNGKKHLRVAQIFYQIRPQTTRKSTHHQLWLVRL